MLLSRINSLKNGFKSVCSISIFRITYFPLMRVPALVQSSALMPFEDHLSKLTAKHDIQQKRSLHVLHVPTWVLLFQYFTLHQHALDVDLAKPGNI